MAQEQKHEVIRVRVLGDETDYESLTGMELLVSPEQVREAFDRTVALNITLAGEVRLTASEIARLGLDRGEP